MLAFAVVALSSLSLPSLPPSPTAPTTAPTAPNAAPNAAPTGPTAATTELSVCDAAKIATRRARWTYDVDGSVDCVRTHPFSPPDGSTFVPADWFVKRAVELGFVVVERKDAALITAAPADLVAHVDAAKRACTFDPKDATPVRATVQATPTSVDWVTLTPHGFERGLVGACLQKALAKAPLAALVTKDRATITFRVAAPASLPSSRDASRSAEVLELIEPDVLKRGIHANRRRIFSCFGRGQPDGDVRWTVTLEWQLDRMGQSHDVKAVASTAPDDVTECMVGRIEGMQFPIEGATPKRARYRFGLTYEDGALEGVLDTGGVRTR